MEWISVANLQRAIEGVASKVTELFVKKEEGKGLSKNDYTDEEKIKLGGIEDKANNYKHPDTEGNKHIPEGGAEGQVLVNSGAGTAAWKDQEQTEVPNMQGATDQAAGKAGIVPTPPIGSQDKVLVGSGNWVEMKEASEQEIDRIISGAFQGKGMKK